MDKKHRKQIEKNINELIRRTNYDKLLKACVTWSLLSPVMCQNIENITLNGDEEDIRNEKHKRLFMKITQRGPEAFELLKKLLIQLQYDSAVQLLNEMTYDKNETSISDARRGLMHSKSNSIPRVATPLARVEENTNLPELTEYTGEIIPKCAVIKTGIIQTDEKIGTYTMNSKDNRGVLYVVNNEHFQARGLEQRKGSQNDFNALLHIFKEFGFKLFAYKDITSKEYFDLLDKLLESEHTRNTQCLVVALMTHGSMRNNCQYVEFKDCPSKVDDILNRLEKAEKEYLKNKPKICIFPFCRKKETGFESQLDTIPDLSDFLICYAANGGREAYRDTLEGSWYTQTLYKLLAKHAHDTSFMDILTMTTDQTSQQISETGDSQKPVTHIFGFKKKLFFNPPKELEPEATLTNNE